MLVIISGTYGVGKTYLIRNLCKNKYFTFIPTYITRPKRTNDFGRFNITLDQFIEKELLNEFISINEHFKYKYGILRKDIETSNNNNSLIYLLDFPFNKIEAFDSYNYKIVILLPPSIDYLKKTLIEIGRIDRINEAIKDYNNNYQNIIPKTNQLLINNDFTLFKLNLRSIIKFIKD